MEQTVPDLIDRAKLLEYVVQFLAVLFPRIERIANPVDEIHRLLNPSPGEYRACHRPTHFGVGLQREQKSGLDSRKFVDEPTERLKVGRLLHNAYGACHTAIVGQGIADGKGVARKRRNPGSG